MRVTPEIPEQAAPDVPVRLGTGAAADLSLLRPLSVSWRLAGSIRFCVRFA